MKKIIVPSVLALAVLIAFAPFSSAEMAKEGGIIETRVQGFAASAGFMIFVSGKKGHRFVNQTAELMWHELLSFTFFKFESPSSKEEEARVLRHLQNTGNKWIASCSNLSKEELDEKIRFKEFWITGEEAVEMGFADGFIGE